MADLSPTDLDEQRLRFSQAALFANSSDVTVLFVPPAFTKDAIVEAIDSGGALHPIPPSQIRGHRARRA